MARIYTNFAKSTLLSSIAAGDLSLTVAAGDGALFPAAGAGSTFDAVLYNTSGQREIVSCTSRTGDVLTIVRAQQGTIALAWNAGDRIGHRLTASALNNILFSENLQQQTPTNCGTAGGTANALTLTPSPAITAYAAGMSFLFKAGVAGNSGVTTVAISGLGTIAVQMNYAACAGGEIRASKWYRITLDTASTAQLEQVSSVGLAELLTTKGDLVAATAANTPARKAVGANGSLFVADSTQSDGLKWKAVGTNGQLIVADSTQSDGLIWTDFSKDPLNVNPNMLLDQINEGALYTVSSAGTTRGPDGWSGVVSVSGGVFKMRQVADPDNAAKMCLEITCTTADAAVGATDLAYLFTDIEGYDISSLSPGTASAGSIVTMLETRSLPAGVYGIRVTNSAGNRAYVSTFTTSGAAAWQQHFLTWALDTTGTWLYTNGTGVRVQICLMAGANYQGSTGSWGATTNFSTASQVNFLSSTSNIGYLRMHVIPGNVVCAYKPADIQRELAKAQRYYWKSFSQGTAPANGLSITYLYNSQVTYPFGFTAFPTEMRGAWTGTLYNYRPGGAAGQWSNGAADSANARFVDVQTRGFSADNTAVAVAAGNWFLGGATANARLS